MKQGWHTVVPSKCILDTLTFVSTLKGKPEILIFPDPIEKNGEFRVKVLSLAVCPRDTIKRISQSLCFFICKVGLSTNSLL